MGGLLLPVQFSTALYDLSVWERKEMLCEVEAHIGLFTHCEEMLQQELIDWHTLEKIYTYRITKIMENTRILRAKLDDSAKDWQYFLSLFGRRTEWGGTAQ